MPIITISRGSYRQGRTVAEGVAAQLGYACISRDEILESLDEFQVPEIRLVRDLHDAFSVLERFPNGKQRYIAAVRSRLLERFAEDNVVYHGLAGHHFLTEVPHVLKIRILADIDLRVAQEMETANVSPREARYILKKDDEERRKWCMFLYGVDIWDPANYHLTLKIGRLSVADATELVASAAQRPTFQSNAAALTELSDMALAAQVRDRLRDFPSAGVLASEGHVSVMLKAPEPQQAEIATKIRSILRDVIDNEKLTVRIDPYY